MLVALQSFVVFFFLCIIAGLFFTAGGQVGRYTKGEGTKENAADDFKLMEHATWSFCTTVPCSRFFNFILGRLGEGKECCVIFRPF